MSPYDPARITAARQLIADTEVVCPECGGVGSFELDAPSRPGMYGVAEIECQECGGAGGWPASQSRRAA